jgi:hypothetical protein
MKEYISIGLKIALIFIVVAVLINDGVVIASVHYLAHDIAQIIADGSARSYIASGRQEKVALKTAYELAEQRGVQLTGFEVEEEAVAVEIKIPPRKTILAEHIPSLRPYLTGSAIARAFFQ